MANFEAISHFSIVFFIFDLRHVFFFFENCILQVRTLMLIIILIFFKYENKDTIMKSFSFLDH